MKKRDELEAIERRRRWWVLNSRRAENCGEKIRIRMERDPDPGRENPKESASGGRRRGGA